MAARGPRPEALQIPDSMHPDIRALLERDQELQAELSAINESLRKKRDERSSLLDNPASETAQLLQALEDEITAQRNIQEDIRAKLGSLGSEKSRTFEKVRGVSERLAILRLELPPLREHRRVTEQAIRRLRVDAAGLQREVDRIKGKLTIVSVPELEKKLKELDVKIAHAKKDPKKATALEAFIADKVRLERTGEQLREYWVLAEKLVDLKNQEDKLQQSILPAEKELVEKEALIKELDAQQKELEKQRKEEEKAGKKEDEAVVRLRQELKAAGDRVRAKIEERRQIKENLTGAGGDTPLSAGISQDAKRRDELQAQIVANRRNIPEVVVSFDRELAPDLLGPRRCNIQSLQDDFGVLVSVQQEDGKLRIRGHADDIARAKDAIEQALQRAKDNRVQAVLSFNPGLARDLIGRAGANIDRIQSHSGAKINVKSKESKIEIQGNAAAVAEAKKVIEEFLAGTTIVEAPLRREYMDIITAKGGRMIRNIQTSSGLKNLSVDRAGMKVVMVGSEEAVQAAKASLDNLLDGCNPDGVEVKFDVNLIGAILGKGGVNINKIEEETCTLLEITKPPANRVGKAATTASLRIKGSRKGVEAARQRVNELLSVNAREEQIMEYDRALLSFLIARPEGNPEGLCVLEAVRRDTGCASIQAVRDTNKLRIVGKAENVVAAKAKLAEVLQEQSKGSLVVEYPLAAFAYLNRKPEEGGRAPLDAIRQETGVRQIRSDKNSGKISIVGDAEQAQAAAAEVRKLLDSIKDRVRTVPLPSDNLIGRVIGPGGSTIRLLEERTKCDITVDKANVAVQIFGEPALLDAAEAQVKEKVF